MSRGARSSGQASLELVAAVPVVIAAALLAWQVAAAGWAAVTAEDRLRADALAARGAPGTVVTLTSEAPVPGPLGRALHAHAVGAVRLP